jgi:hypothetical protein
MSFSRPSGSRAALSVASSSRGYSSRGKLMVFVDLVRPFEVLVVPFFSLLPV